MFETLHGKGLLIHHWDTDGICSATLLLEALKDKNVTNVTPTLGNYYLTAEELTTYKHYDYIIVADMGLPEDNINLLATQARVLIFDHHLQAENTNVFHYNPIIKGENPDLYPSASWIVNTYLKNNVNLYAILGILGDHEQNITKNTYIMEFITRYLKDHLIPFQQALDLVHLIDSNYKLRDKKAVEQAPRYLLTRPSVHDLQTNRIWNENIQFLEKEIDKAYNTPADVDTDEMIVKTIHTTYDIISTITRRVFWDFKKNTVIINTNFFADKDQVYMRSIKDAQPMIARGKQLGYKCGGKKEVLGAIVPKNNTTFIT